MKMKKKGLVILGSFFSLIALFNLGISKIQKANDSSLENILTEAKADDETVTCSSDPGDTCIIGSTTIKDYDESCATWFWG